MKGWFFVTCLLFSTIAEADSRYGGVSLRSSLPIDNVQGADFKYDPGLNTSLFIGYAFDGYWDGLCAELEGNYSYNPIDSLSLGGQPTQLHGHLQLYSAMINLIYSGFEHWTIRPYYGGGFGWGWQYADLSGPNLANTKTKASHFVCQTIFGLTYPLSCSAELSLEYRYFLFDQELETHSIGLAIRKRF